MSYWTIPQEMQSPAIQRTSHNKKSSLFINLFVPFALAILGIPLYLMIILKIIGMMQ